MKKISLKVTASFLNWLLILTFCTFCRFAASSSSLKSLQVIVIIHVVPGRNIVRLNPTAQSVEPVHIKEGVVTSITLHWWLIGNSLQVLGELSFEGGFVGDQ